MCLGKPWNPVPKKKHDPNAPSLIVKDDTLYSTAWKNCENHS